MVVCDPVTEEKGTGPSPRVEKSKQSKQKSSPTCRTYSRAEFGDVVRRHQGAILELVQRLTSDRTKAQDITQEVFIQAFRNIERFRGQSSIFTWLYRIALNQCRAEYRKLKAKRRLHYVRLVTEGEGERHPSQDLASDHPDPSERLEEKERGAIVRKVVSELNDTLRDVSILRDMEGRSYEEVANILQIPVGTVRSRLHRARYVLRQALSESV
ncbi:MAG: sigma-70 family RNA polymerase sigma factor [Planctomycetota bacterium]